MLERTTEGSVRMSLRASQSVVRRLKDLIDDSPKVNLVSFFNLVILKFRTKHCRASFCPLSLSVPIHNEKTTIFVLSWSIEYSNFGPNDSLRRYLIRRVRVHVGRSEVESGNSFTHIFVATLWRRKRNVSEVDRI